MQSLNKAKRWLRTDVLSWRWVIPVALFLVGIGLQRLAHHSPHLVEEYYSRSIYLTVARGVSLIGKPFPFSVAELLLVLLPIAGLAVILIRTRRQLLLGQGRRQILASRTCEFLWILAIAFLVFQVTFGLNYQRPPLGAELQLVKREPTAVELEEISTNIISEVNRAFSQSRLAANITQRDRTALLNAIESSFQASSLLGNASRGGFASPKPVFASRAMTKLGIGGIYSPFTGEPNFNREQPEIEMPFSVAHEKAHQRGYAREDEASFIAYVVCTSSNHPFVRYSGYLRGLRVLAALRAAVPPEKYRGIVDRLDAGVRADLRESDAFWQRGLSRRLSKVADRANDTYLRANSVRSGTANYGEVVALIIGYYLTYSPNVPQVP
jgi:hypothetical protein